MANIIGVCSDVFTEEYALAKIFVYAIPVFICINAFATGQFVLSYICGFFVILMLLGLLSFGINNLRENKNEILTFNIQQLAITTVKTAVAITPQVSIAVMIAMTTKELIPEIDGFPQFQMIINIMIWCLLFSMVMTSYLSFAKHLRIKEAYNIKIIYESVVDVFVNLVFITLQMVIANSIFIGLMVYIFTLFNMKLTHPGFLFYCSILVIVNLSVLANFLAQVSYDFIKGSDEDYKDKYKIGSTISTSGFSGGVTAQPSQSGYNRDKSNVKTQQNTGIGRSNFNKKSNNGIKSPNRSFGSGGQAKNNFKRTGSINNSRMNKTQGSSYKITGNNSSRNFGGNSQNRFGQSNNQKNISQNKPSQTNNSNDNSSSKNNMQNNQQRRPFGGNSSSHNNIPPKRNFGGNQSKFGNNRRPNGGNNFGNNKP